MVRSPLEAIIWVLWMESGHSLLYVTSTILHRHTSNGTNMQGLHHICMDAYFPQKEGYMYYALGVQNLWELGHTMYSINKV